MTTIEKLEAKIQECLTKIEAKTNKPFPMIPIRYDLKGRCGGQFCTEFGESWFNFNCVLMYENGDNYINEVVPHEVAHYIVKVLYPRATRSHGKEWQSVMKFLGLEPKRCHNFDTSNSRSKVKRFRYNCPCNVVRLFTLGEHKKCLESLNRGWNRYKCGICKQGLVSDGEMIIV